MRRQPTAEQKAKAAARRERFAALAKQVAAMSEDERAGLVLRLGAVVTVEGRPLSAFNSCLVLTQFPGCSLVGGFRQWKAHGRSVKKGAAGLMIWVPTGRTVDADGPAPADAATASEPATTEVGAKRAGFVMGTVFDVTQTDETRPHGLRFDEAECGGAFDGVSVTSDADPGL